MAEVTLKRREFKIFITLIVIIFIIQGAIILYLIANNLERTKIEKNLNATLQNQITSLKLDNSQFQDQLFSIGKIIGSVSNQQTSLQSQLSQIQATTSSDFSGIIQDEIKGVVTIKTDVSQGSGFIITQDGYIITNAHVLKGGKFVNVYTFDQGRYNAQLIGYNLSIDLALLKINGTFTRTNLGNSDNAKIGEKVIAIGNPLGLSFTATEGIISARDRTGNNGLPYYFQTDASLNPGNSGGPIINTKGEVIGISNYKIAGAENIGLALEINPARLEINRIALEALNKTLI